MFFVVFFFSISGPCWPGLKKAQKPRVLNPLQNMDQNLLPENSPR